MRTLRDIGRRESGLRWLGALLLPAALACGGGSPSPGPTTPPTTAVTMPPTAAGDPSAPWTRPAPAVLTADPGPDRTVHAGAHVVLDGTRSTAPAGAITTFSWESIGATTVTLTSAGTARPEFDAPLVTSGAVALAFTLTVVDGTGASTTATQQVVVHEPEAAASTSSVGVVRRAMQDGSLDRDAAAQYLAFAAFGDPRLPAQYRGTRPEPSASWTVHYLAREYASLSTAAQSVVLPFLLPPGHPARAAGLPAQAAAAAPPEQRGIEGAHVAVWYWSDLPGGATLASSLVDEIEGVIWPRLEQVWRTDHMPDLNDAAVGAAFRGTRGKLNIFLDSIARDAQLASAYGYESAYGNDSASSPSFVVLRHDLPWSGKDPMGLIQCAAHEITHSCQDSFKHAESYSNRRLLYEGIAMWAVDDVYPGSNAEHPYAPLLLDRPWLPLDDESSDRPYGAYLFFQWATRPQDDRDFVRRVFLNFQGQDSLAAIDNAFPSYEGHVIGLEFNWGSFLEALWNRDPSKFFRASDGLTEGAKHAATRSLAVGGSGDGEFIMAAEVPYLSGRYHHFTVDPGVRTIQFFDGLTQNLRYNTVDGTTTIVAGSTTEEDVKGAIAKVLVKRGDTWTALLPGPSTDGSTVGLCQDDPADEVDEIAVVFGDSYPKRGHGKKPRGLAPRLWVTNIGCFQWRGSVSATSTDPSAPAETIQANVVFTPWKLGGLRMGVGNFVVLSASVTWSISGNDASGCNYAGSDAFALTFNPMQPAGSLTFAPAVVLPGGKYRAYTATGTSGGHKSPYTVTCGTNPPTQHEREVTWLETNATGANVPPAVSADGATAAGEYDDGSYRWTWSFTREVGFTPLSR